MGSLLFEDPWALVVGLVALAGILRVGGKRRGDAAGGRGLVMASWVALLLGVGLYGLSRWVETDREALTRLTEDFVRATSPVDEPALANLLDSRAFLLGPGGMVWDELSAGFIAEKLKQHQVEGSGLRQADAVASRPGWGTSTMDVSSRVSGYPARTTWQIVWQQQPDGDWTIQSMTWLTFRNQPATRNLY